MNEEESPTKMAHQLSSDHIPPTNEEVRVSPPSSEVVQILETEVVVIDKQNDVVNDHVARPKTRKRNTKEDKIIEQSSALQNVVSSSTCLARKEVSSSTTTTSCEASTNEDNGRERLKRHRIEVAGRVWIPDIWGQEDLLKDWIDCSTFDACLVPKGITSAREALVEDRRRATSGRQRIENRC